MFEDRISDDIMIYVFRLKHEAQFESAGINRMNMNLHRTLNSVDANCQLSSRDIKLADDAHVVH